MTLLFHGLITQVPFHYWAVIGVSIVLILVGVHALYHELKATFTDASSPSVIEDDPKPLAVADQGFAWIAGIIFTLVGLVFLYIFIKRISMCFC